MSDTIWVLNCVDAALPCGVFASRAEAEATISKYKLKGTLTAFPLGKLVYEWAVEGGHFKPKTGETNPRFIG